MGHTFWDQDIWMYPPLVLLHPDLARSSVRYRKERLPAARRIAKEYGYKGRKMSIYPKTHKWTEGQTGSQTDLGTKR